MKSERPVARFSAKAFPEMPQQPGTQAQARSVRRKAEEGKSAAQPATNNSLRMGIQEGTSGTRWYGEGRPSARSAAR